MSLHHMAVFFIKIIEKILNSDIIKNKFYETFIWKIKHRLNKNCYSNSTIYAWLTIKSKNVWT